MGVVDVISHPGPARKRRRVWAYALRRLGALAVTLGTLAAVAWLAPRLAPSSSAPGTSDIALTAQPASGP